MTSHNSLVRGPEDPNMESSRPAAGDATREEIKASRKLAKQQKKQMRKSKMEEEFLRSLRGPKDTKVVLADRSLLEKWMNGGKATASPSPTARSSTFSAQDFPALGPTGRSARRRQAATYKSAVDPSAPPCEFVPLVKPSAEGVQAVQTEVPAPPPPPPPPAEDFGKTPACSRPELNTLPCSTSLLDGSQPSAEALEKRDEAKAANPPMKQGADGKGKKTKKKDPIVLSLGDLIANPVKKDKKRVHGSKIRRINESDLLCGNMLDSSSPKRSRGKHREVEKVRITKLKQAIIRDRVMKMRERNNLSAGDLADAKKLKVELEKYLSELVVKKMRLAERRKKRAEEKKTERGVRKEGEEEATDATGSDKKLETLVTPPAVEKRKVKYRKYCQNKYHPPLDSSVEALIRGIVYLQDRAFAKDPIKARAKRRFVVGLREVKKYLTVKKIKMLIVAPDLEAQDTVYQTIEELKKAALMQNVPYVFALDRRRLGYVTKKNVPVSAIGILHYDGLEEKFAAVKETLTEASEMQPSTKVGDAAPAEDNPSVDQSAT